MKDEELKKLKRIDLLELLLEQNKKNEQLQIQLKNMQKQLESREIMINQAGSIANAALQLSGIFEAAQTAADQYLENIQSLNERAEEICAKQEEESLRIAEERLTETKEKCEAMEVETRQKCELMETETKEKCEAMLLSAREESQNYWDRVNQQMKDFTSVVAELRENPFVQLGKETNEEQ